MAIDESAFGLDHPDVAIGLNNLGRVLESKATLLVRRLSSSVL